MSAPIDVTPKFGDLAFTRESPYGSVTENAFAGALSFMRRRYSRDLSGVDVAVMGVPLDLTTSGRPGTRLGPRAIRAASAHIAWAPPWPWPSDVFADLAVVDYGDCQFDPGRPMEIPEAIRATAASILSTGTALLTLGGDHFITWPLLKAHADKHGPLSIIQFDAHTDTWADDGERLDHGTMLWHAIEEGLVVPEHSAQIGIRTHNDDPMGVNIFNAIEVHKQGAEAIAEKVRKIVGDNPVYITFDIDCLDPSAAPGTGTPVIGGLTTWQAQEVLRGLAGLNVVGMDVVEVSPPYDHAEITALAGATLACDLLALHAAGRKARGE